jgi:radical SAM superfamily enzyme YgiQ (UPF0313 family)
MFRVVLISPYELGRQPFALAEPAALLKQAGFAVDCIDLSLQTLDPDLLGQARLVAIYVGMHTATRIAVEALPRVRRLAPKAYLAVYGLYAPMNEDLLRSLGVGTVLGGETEPALVSLAERLRANGAGSAQTEPVIRVGKVEFVVPDRTGLPELSRYARLVLPDGTERVAGFAEASRGCKHLCRHCPIVPVYEGKFRAVPADVVIEDIRQQMALGATHISFGDPDFFNGPTHAMRIARALHEEFPKATFDATIKVQHLIEHAVLLPELRRLGCLFITSAVEAVDEEILRHLAKNHCGRDFDRAVALTRAAGIALAPTFVAFTPWTTLDGYLALLERILELQLIEAVPPVQLSIRLLVPRGSRLLELPGFAETLMPFDAKLLGYPWRHSDPRVDRLQQNVQRLVSQDPPLGRHEAFAEVWRIAHESAQRPARSIGHAAGEPVPRLSEPWYCCAEPTDQQLQAV